MTASAARLSASIVLLFSAHLPARELRAQQRGPVGTLVASNMNDNTATVLDAGSGTVLATLPTGEAPHEVAISHSGRWAAVSNYGVRGKPGSTITVIDIAQLVVVRTLSLTGYQRPHGMAFFPGDTVLAVTSESSQAVLLVDVRDGHIMGTRPTRGRSSHMVAMSAAGDRLFTGNIADGTISDLEHAPGDSAHLIKVGRQPEGIAVSPDGNTVWAGSNRDSIVVVVDTRNGVAIDTLRGFGLPYRMAITPDGKLAIVTDPARAEVRVYSAPDRKLKFTITVPRDSLVSTAEVPGSPSPEGVAVSRDSRWAFVTLQGRNRVITIDLVRGTITSYAPTGVWSDGIGFSPLKH
jgi:DNA-binding beta-propeller fold protein YncE